jgi:hypothetical protein
MANSMNKIVKEKTYVYGFSDKDTAKISLKKGLSIDVIKRISQIKQEPK